MTVRGLWCVVPAKPLEEAKQRLAPVLSASERQRLAEHMLRDVLQAAASARCLAGVAVVTGDPVLAALARREGAHVIDETHAAGTNAAIEHGARVLAAAGACGVLVLHADLPAATAAEIDALAEGHSAGQAMAFVASWSDQGTNALAISPPDRIAFQFGHRSAAAHREAARAAGIAAVDMDLPGLALDIDREADVQAFVALGTRSQTARYLACIGGADRFRGAAAAPRAVSCP